MTVRELMDKLRDYDDNTEVRFWDHVEQIDVVTRTQCLCYHSSWSYNGETFVPRPVCYGTKELEHCSCGGDKRSCNFYEYVREEPEDSAIYIIPMKRGF